jgi:FAD:protein FMN transferase
MHHASRITLAVCAVAVAAGCHNPAAPGLRTESKLIMDTYVSISAYAPRSRADKALAAAFSKLEEIDREFNHLDSTSPVYAFNQSNEPITDTAVVRVVRAAQAVSAASGGVFDITVEPLVRLWGFYGDNPALPPERAIDSCRRLVDFRNLVVEPGRVTKRYPWVRIDLGGIAKGYALAEAAGALRANGVDSAVIDLGGDVYAIGHKGRDNWRVGIRNPRGEGIIGVAAVSNLAVVTSGDYERYFIGPDSVRYCHIIDPRTGRPAHGIASTTIFTRDPISAQGWSKVLFILGPGAIRLGDSVGAFQALVVDDSMRVVCSPGLAEAVTLDTASLHVRQ